MNNALNKAVPFLPYRPLTLTLYEKWKRERSLLLSVLVLLSGVMLVATSTLASQSPIPRSTEATAKEARSEFTSLWVGSYDGVGRACGGNTLRIDESSFSWGNCISAKTRSISVTEKEIAFSVDRKTDCGWSGWTIVLTRNKAESQVVDVNAYSSLEAYQAKDYSLFCTFSKELSNK